MFDVPAISMETMMKLSIIMGGLLFFLCSLVFATDFLRSLFKRIRKRGAA